MNPKRRKRRAPLDAQTEKHITLLGAYGLSGKCIAQETGLERGAIYRELRRLGVRLRTYRDGENTHSVRVVNACRAKLSKRRHG